MVTRCFYPVLNRTKPQMLAILLTGVGFLAQGCSSPEQPSLTSNNPHAQNEWIANAVDQGDWGAVPGLIELLESSDPAERLVAIGALRSITQEENGYRIADPPAIRGQAVDRWVAWWIEKEASSDASDHTVRADTVP